MTTHIAIIQGHPDARGGHFGHALAAAYAAGAERAGHEVRTLAVAALDFPVLRDKDEWDTGTPPESIRLAQETIAWSDHLLIVYPLWLGSMPGITKGFFEQCLRPGFAFGEARRRGMPPQKLKGRSARVVVTMGMPSFFYHVFYRAHSLRSFERNVLNFCGIRPVRSTVAGAVETKEARERALAAMRRYGAKAA